MAGYIKLYRGWRECEAFKNEPCTQREAWVWLLENAAWKPCQRRDAQGALVSIERGQFHTSIRTLAAEWQWSRGRVERFLNDLKTSHMISHETGHGGLLITVCNYDKYQAYEPSAGPSPEPSAGPSTSQAQGHTRRSKEVKEDNKPEAKASPDAVFWQMALDYLGQDKRGLIGRWIKDYTRPRVAEAIAAAQVERAIDPVPYIAATLRRRGKRGDEEEMTMPC